MIRSLFIVPDVILDVSRSGIFDAVKVIRSLFIVPDVILAASRSGILAVVKTGICPSVNPVKLAPEPLNNVAAMVPLTSNFCAGFLPIPKLLLGMSHIKFDV